MNTLVSKKYIDDNFIRKPNADFGVSISKIAHIDWIVNNYYCDVANKSDINRCPSDDELYVINSRPESIYTIIDVTRTDYSYNVSLPPSIFSFTDANSDLLEKVQIVELPTKGTLIFYGYNVVANQIFNVSVGSFLYDLVYVTDSNTYSSYFDYFSFRVKTFNCDDYSDTSSFRINLSKQPYIDYQLTDISDAVVTGFRVNNFSLGSGSYEVLSDWYSTYNNAMAATDWEDFSGSKSYTGLIHKTYWTCGRDKNNPTNKVAKSITI